MSTFKLDEYVENCEESIIAVSGVTLAEIYAEDRLSQAVADARAGLWYLCYHVLGMTYRDIADRYNRDHSTIVHAVKRAESNTIGSQAIIMTRKLSPRMFKNSRRVRERASTADRWKT